MLILARRVGERITLSDGVELFIQRINRGTVRIGFTAPDHIRIARNELLKGDDDHGNDNPRPNGGR